MRMGKTNTIATRGVYRSVLSAFENVSDDVNEGFEDSQLTAQVCSDPIRQSRELANGVCIVACLRNLRLAILLLPPKKI
jgi:hypothetical protein